MRVVLPLVLFAGACNHQLSAREMPILAGEFVEVEHRDGRTETALLVATGQGPALRTSSGDVALASVSRVSRTQRLRGGLQGLGIGALSAVSLTVVLGLAAAGDDTSTTGSGHADSSPMGISDGGAILLGGIVLGGLGSMAGFLIGALIGSDDVYEPGAQGQVTLSGPPGSAMGATVRF